jgi:hypothetical protein
MYSAQEKKIENEKNPGKVVGVVYLILNTFHYCNFFPISTDFELFRRF